MVNVFLRQGPSDQDSNLVPSAADLDALTNRPQRQLAEIDIEIYKSWTYGQHLVSPYPTNCELKYKNRLRFSRILSRTKEITRSIDLSQRRKSKPITLIHHKTEMVQTQLIGFCIKMFHKTWVSVNICHETDTIALSCDTGLITTVFI